MEPLGAEMIAMRTQLERLDGLEQIRTRIHHCARALDRLDRNLLREQFWPDAQVDYGAIYRGSIAGFLEVAMRFQGSMRDTHHLVGTVLIEVDNDQARSESYVHAHHVLVASEGVSQLVVGGRYLDGFERREGTWRLSYRTEIIDWGEQRLSDRWFDSNNELPKGQRSQEDLSYRFLEKPWPNGHNGL